ncbi:Gag-pol polyprotein, related [Eimeria brunetti]|uniref:RNA-directed DNA polymerase n=1 Tax=Eimeria brunetti TaxID=51314 RepID=U6LZZ1_9EIME|nr:Gag-pol polyprotein, related [Eimeria brunetti]
MEPGRDTSIPAAGVGRPAPRNRDHDAGGRKDPEMNHARLEQEIAELCRQMAAQITMGQRPALQMPIAYKGGRNIGNFLDLVQLEFLDLGIGARHVTQEKMIEMMAKNVWQGDHNAYSARFAAIVAQGVTMTPDELVGFYLANLPKEQCRGITHGGARKFKDWQEAATALAASEAPWKATNEERLRYQPQLADARSRAENAARGGNWREGETCGTTIRKRADTSVEGRDTWVRTVRSAMGQHDAMRKRAPDSGSDTGRCEDSARKRTHDVTQRNEDKGAADLPWWREGMPLELAHECFGSLCGTGKTAVLKLDIAGYECEGLLDTGVSRSFIRPAAVERLGKRVIFPPKACTFTVANGDVIRIDCTVTRLSMICGGECSTGYFLVGPVPHDVILGLDWLINHRVAWYFQSDKFRTYVNGRWCELPVQRKKRQGRLMCAIVEHHQAKTGPQGVQSAVVAAPEDADTEDSPWPTAKLEYTEFDAWYHGHDALRLPPHILPVLQQHRLLFPDNLPDGLPPKRPYDHRILLLPGNLPTKTPICSMSPNQLAYHTKEIARLTSKGWIGPTYSPICAPTIMVGKQDDGSGERKMRMVVNYQALNALTIAREFLMPTVQTILEMLGGAKYFSTLGLEAGFHQIRIAKEDRWKTAVRSVQGLFEYKVVPFGLKGAPAKFQANINAYLQPLPGDGVIACLDDVLIYSPGLGTLASFLRQVLSIFLAHQFYPRFTKCKFAEQELTYLGYTIGAAGIKPSVDKIPNPTQPYILYTAASGYAPGAALEQDGKSVSFLSQVMRPAQQRSIYDQELLALVTALDKWRHLLRGAKVTAYTDHPALTYLQHINTHKPEGGRTARWLDFLAEFQDLTIFYLQGARNQVADALSRHSQHVPPSADPELPAEGTTLTPSPLTLLQPGGDPLPARYPTRNKPRDYRAEAGIRPRGSRWPAAAAASPLPKAAPEIASLPDAPKDSAPGAAPCPPLAPPEKPPPKVSDETPTPHPSYRGRPAGEGRGVDKTHGPAAATAAAAHSETAAAVAAVVTVAAVAAADPG